MVHFHAVTTKCPPMSRLDGLILLGDWPDPYPKISQLALPKPMFDHCLKLLDSRKTKMGPTPFHFKLMWVERNEFSKLMQAQWKEIRVETSP